MKIEILTNRVSITANSDETRDWATRPNQVWPLSELKRLGGVHVELDGRNGDLLDVYTTGEDGMKTLEYVGTADELTAFIEYALQDAHTHLQVVLAHQRTR